MAQESKGMAVAQKQPHMNDDEDEVRDLQKQQPRSGGIYDKVRRQAERFASTWLGQYVIERADRALKMIEDTAKWSLPRDENACLPERPLPWTLFLWMILVLRLTRIWLSLGALMIGNGPVSPSDVIYFIQTRRRKLRAIRVHGLKVMRQRQQEAAMGSSTNYSQKFAFWWSRAICRPGVQRENSGRLFHIRGGVSEQKSNQNQSQAGQRQPIAKRPRDEDCSIDHNLTIEEMLAKYANENSEDDVDFVPDAEDEENDDDSDSSNDSSNTDSSAETSASELEKHDEHNEKEEKAEVKAKAEPATDLGHNEPITRNGNDHKKPLQAQSSDLAVQSISQQLLPKEDQWKASPGHVSAASTRLYGTSNTVAAVFCLCFCYSVHIFKHNSNH
ncbi:uncharacterized protein LOC115626833 isoform X3 [Scaptodrosophila lebanonensis]|uniref:Uncharacterized protein LOC115626833 isoform X3 n=1 Tax=Drosophila lebanonensis TaxID=7225 RepID=A0A6J2TRQ4_DROLE|nr:uncharacterized protein LOC115626833 isoform X3 [Scaptodrosophila lebanonensis]